jgi:hypothetical protein
MFSDNPNIIKLDEKIFWYKGFMSPEEVAQVNKLASEVKRTRHPFEHVGFWPMSDIQELKPIWDKLSEFLYPEYVIHPALNMIYYPTGAEMKPHCDSPGEDHAEELTIPDVWSTCCLLSWGACVYFGDFEGGEIYYPNRGVEIPVQPGDLVIHGAHSDCEHGVKPTTKGERYVFSNFSLKAEKNPGTFYNYKTPEYYKQLEEDGIGNWAYPLKENPDIIPINKCSVCDGEYFDICFTCRDSNINA